MASGTLKELGNHLAIVLSGTNTEGKAEAVSKMDVAIGISAVGSLLRQKRHRNTTARRLYSEALLAFFFLEQLLLRPALVFVIDVPDDKEELVRRRVRVAKLRSN